MSECMPLHSMNMKCRLSRPRVGISVVSNGSSKITVAVVPRTWFGETVPAVKISRGDNFIILPDKFKRELIFDEEAMEIAMNLKKGFSTRPHPTKEKHLEARKWYSGEEHTESIINDLENFNEATDSSEHEMLIAVFLMMWKYYYSKNKKNKIHKFELLEQIQQFNLGGTSNIVFLGKFLIENVKRYMRELRRTYKEQTIQTTAVKGRIDLMRSAPNISSGIPLLTCRVDEFNIQAPHYSALMTALEVLSSLRPTQELDYLTDLHKHINKEARKLRGYFREIPALNKPTATRILIGTALPPQLRKWKYIFQYAEKIINNKSAMEDNDDVKGFTPPQTEASYVWEDILFDYIGAFGADREKEPKMVDPWQIKGTTKSDKEAKKKPDIRFLLPHPDDSEKVCEVILDAKYYLREPANRTILDNKEASRAVMEHNNWQMMGYAISPLKEKEDFYPRVVIMGFPKTTGDSEKPSLWNESPTYELHKPLLIESPELRVFTPILKSLGIPFPSSQQFKREFSNKSESQYFEAVGEKMKAEIQEMIKDNQDVLFPVSTP
jgi:5-methylcytosine-specific restriction endonuclease McrBC regulatory subunit McrC